MPFPYVQFVLGSFLCWKCSGWSFQPSFEFVLFFCFHFFADTWGSVCYFFKTLCKNNFYFKILTLAVDAHCNEIKQKFDKTLKKYVINFTMHCFTTSTFTGALQFAGSKQEKQSRRINFNGYDRHVIHYKLHASPRDTQVPRRTRPASSTSWGDDDAFGAVPIAAKVRGGDVYDWIPKCRPVKCNPAKKKYH